MPDISQAGAAASDPGSLTGKVVGRFAIREPLGAGGMGQVYLAEDTTLQRGTASPGSTTLTFTNHRNKSCTLEDDGTTMSLLTLTGQSSIIVPAKSGAPPVNGTLTVAILTSAPTGTYTYQSTCCPQAGNPQIVYQ